MKSGSNLSSMRAHQAGSPEVLSMLETPISSMSSQESLPQVLHSLLQILESLFFSMPIPDEIAKKYNFLKEQKYSKVGLTFTPITKTTHPMVGSKSSHSFKGKERSGFY
jgi:hypothetical protein